MRVGKYVHIVIGLVAAICCHAQNTTLTAPIHYNAADSIVLQGNGVATIYGQGKVTYETMELNAEEIRMVLDSSIMHAKGRYDSIEEDIVGKPVFKDGTEEYESLELSYNLKTQKGFIREVTTQQGEGYVVADKTKKGNTDVMMMGGGKYTTCSDHEHPHFYLKMTKAKVKPGDYIATGPAYMVVGEVPVPLAIPFGFFPFTQSYSSGIIMPTFGDDYSRGLYLRGFGYYFAISDHIDMEVTGDIYTKGTWAIYGKSRYAARYKCRGNIDINYRVDKTSERGMPDYSESKNLKIAWTHQQDQKANPFATFSASVNFSTSGYNRSNINSYYNGELNSENTKQSTISYTQRFPDSPWNISMAASITQRTKDSTITMTAPDMSVNMSSIYPFRRKMRVGKERWYEKIKLSYSGNAKIACNNMKEKQLLHSNFLSDWQTGIKHSVPISASWMLFKYLSLTPSFSMTDRMYFQRRDRHWDEKEQKLVRDTTNGFYNVFDFNVSMALQTKLYGYYIPSRKLFPHSKVDRFRHVFTPSMSFSYRPDFGKDKWGYYGSYDEPIYAYDDKGNQIITGYTKEVYSRYEGAMYGNASKGLSATLNFGVQNNIEMKLRNLKDTTGKEPFKVYSIIDNLGINGAYNFAADSMKFSNFNVNLRLKIPWFNYTLNLSTTLDPYMYEYNVRGVPVRTNKQYWHNGRFPHWSGTNFSLSYTFSPQVIKKWFEKGKKNDNHNDNHNDNDNEDVNMDPMEVQSDGSMTNAKQNRGGQDRAAKIEGDYMKTEIPWSLTLSYSLRYGDKAHTTENFIEEKMQYKMGLTQNLSISASLGLGTGWKASMTTSYDITMKKWSYTNFNVSRDLHCWNMSASFVPFGPYKSYNFHIGVNASMLADLKYDKSSTDSTNKKVTWW